MMFDLPDDDTLYEALVAKDPGYEGRAYVCVTTTGIFCRFICPARKPNRENCKFHETIAACIENGFRPCRRCHPMAPAAEADPAICTLLDLHQQHPARRWSEKDIAALGFDPSTVRRSFKRHFGATFLEIVRLSRLRDGFTVMAAGERVIDAGLEAGFESPSGFRSAFARLLGQSPSHFIGHERLKADWIETPLGPMITVSDRQGLHLLEFADRKLLPSELKRLRKATQSEIGLGRFAASDQVEEELGRYFRGESADFKVPLCLHGSAFARRVWDQLRRIPAGETVSYATLASALGHPNATRAVARANGANQIGLVIPCHRVIGADGSLTGYGGGLWRKQRLIEIERQFAKRVAKNTTGARS